MVKSEMILIGIISIILYGLSLSLQRFNQPYHAGLLSSDNRLLSFIFVY